MSQISPPVRIVLVAAVLFLAAWMTVLKPKSDDTGAPAPSSSTGNVASGNRAVSEPGKLAERAKDAATQTEAASAKHAGEEPTTSTTGKSGSAAATAEQPAGAVAQAAKGELAGVPQAFVKAVLHQKVSVLLFWNPKSSDDRAVRRSLAKVDRWDGRVYVKAVPVSRVSRYGRIARGVDLQQTPTVVVVDPALKATTLVGFEDTRSIDQAVVDAFRRSVGLFPNDYLRAVHRSCVGADNDFFHLGQPRNLAEVRANSKLSLARWSAWVSEFRAIDAPAKYRAFKRATLADAAVVTGVLTSWKRLVAGKPTLARLVAFVRTENPKLVAAGKRFNKRMDKQHLLTCGSNT